MSEISLRKGLLALSPIAVLLVVYFVGSIVAGDFYRISITTAFLLASVYAMAITRTGSLNERIDIFSRGAANSRIMYMVWIFVMAGAFAAVAKAMGAVDASVALTLNAVPVKYLPAGIFLASCLVSMSVGTSMGTIIALAPIAVGLAGPMGCGVPWVVAIVVGGAFFGDNLSFISDTTIAATQTQGCSMRSKFSSNFMLVLPAAIVTLLIYAFSSNEVIGIHIPSVSPEMLLKCLPYLVVIVASMLGMNVMVVLALGFVAAAIIGLSCGSLSGVNVLAEMGNGVKSMSELIVVTMLAGGLLEMVRLNGGMDFLIKRVVSCVHSKRTAESAICGLTAFANVCTANNTIAILTVGGISRDISREYKISPRRAASLMDTTSCFVQGIIPYGAQLLLASGIVSEELPGHPPVSPLEIIPYLYYPMAVGVMILVSIFIKRVYR